MVVLVVKFVCPSTRLALIPVTNVGLNCKMRALLVSPIQAKPARLALVADVHEHEPAEPGSVGPQLQKHLGCQHVNNAL